MTRGGYLPPMERWRRQGGKMVTATVHPTGAVLVHEVTTIAREGQRSTVELWPTLCVTVCLGWTDPDDPDAWKVADRLVRQAGWRPAGDWTTVGRMPAARLVHDTTTSRGTVPRGN